MCGNEVIQKIYFPSVETDILTPSSKLRTVSYMPVFIKTEKNTYTLDKAPCADDIELTLSNDSVASVKKEGKYAKITSLSVGTSQCIAKHKAASQLSASLLIHVLDPDKLSDNMESGCSKPDRSDCEHIYRNGIQLYTNSVSQGYYFYNDDYIWFTQLGEDKENENYKKTDNGVAYSRTRLLIFKYYPASGKKSSIMEFKQAGHGQNLVIERKEGNDYLWFANYGTLKYCTNTTPAKCLQGYSFSQTLSRVKWEENDQKYHSTTYPNQISEHYYYSDPKLDGHFYRFEPGLDEKNDRFAFIANCTKGSDQHNVKSDCIDGKTTYVRMFSLSKLNSINKTDTLELPRPIDYIDDGNGHNQYVNDDKKSIQVKNLSKLPLADSFDKNDFPDQGFEIENGILYAITGNIEKISEEKCEYRSKIKIKLYTYKGDDIGTYYLRTSHSTHDNYLNNDDMNKVANYTKDNSLIKHCGYFEPEGIRVNDGKVYILTSVLMKTEDDGIIKKIGSRQFIFKFDLIQ